METIDQIKTWKEKAEKFDKIMGFVAMFEIDTKRYQRGGKANSEKERVTITPELEEKPKRKLKRQFGKGALSKKIAHEIYSDLYNGEIKTANYKEIYKRIRKAGMKPTRADTHNIWVMLRAMDGIIFSGSTRMKIVTLGEINRNKKVLKP